MASCRTTFPRSPSRRPSHDRARRRARRRGDRLGADRRPDRHASSPRTSITTTSARRRQGRQSGTRLQRRQRGRRARASRPAATGAGPWYGRLPVRPRDDQGRQLPIRPSVRRTPASTGRSTSTATPLRRASADSTLQQGDSLVVAAVNDSDPNGAARTSAACPLTAAPGSPSPSRSSARRRRSARRTTCRRTPRSPRQGATVQAGGDERDRRGRRQGDAHAHRSAVRRRSGRRTRGDVRSASESVCVTDGADGYCGTIDAAGRRRRRPAPPAAAPSAVVDRDVPFGSVASIPEQQHYKRGKAPRELTRLGRRRGRPASRRSACG